MSDSKSEFAYDQKLCYEILEEHGLEYKDLDGSQRHDVSLANYKRVAGWAPRLAREKYLSSLVDAMQKAEEEREQSPENYLVKDEWPEKDVDPRADVEREHHDTNFDFTVPDDCYASDEEIQALIDAPDTHFVGVDGAQDLSFWSTPEGLVIASADAKKTPPPQHEINLAVNLTIRLKVEAE